LKKNTFMKNNNIFHCAQIGVPLPLCLSLSRSPSFLNEREHNLILNKTVSSMMNICNATINFSICNGYKEGKKI
jgi:hypothetical protein